MQIIQAELFDGSESMIVVTTNGTLRKSGALVMGGGAAAQSRIHYPYIENVAGNEIQKNGTKTGDWWLYGFLPLDGRVGIFQTKDLWRNKSDVQLILFSTALLAEWCRQNPAAQVRMNYPGIGLGGLSEKTIEPIISILPDSVTVCRR